MTANFRLLPFKQWAYLVRAAGPDDLDYKLGIRLVKKYRWPPRLPLDKDLTDPDMSSGGQKEGSVANTTSTQIQCQSIVFSPVRK